MAEFAFKVGDVVRFVGDITRGGGDILKPHDVGTVVNSDVVDHLQVDFGTSGMWFFIGSAATNKLVQVTTDTNVVKAKDCTCNKETIMATGCTCGAITRYVSPF